MKTQLAIAWVGIGFVLAVLVGMAHTNVSAVITLSSILGSRLPLGSMITNMASITSPQALAVQTGAASPLDCDPLPNVTSPADSGPGSLRQAIADVCPGGNIGFSGDTTIYLSSELTLTKQLTIDGGTHAVTISGDTGHDGSGNVRVFNITASGDVTLNHLSIVSGKAASDWGGGISNEGTLRVQNCTLSGNYSDNGGGAIDNGGTLTVLTSTLTNNTSYTGGGINNRGDSMVTASTISGNLAYTDGGGIANWHTLTVQNSTVSGNSADSGCGISNSSTLTVLNSTISGNSGAEGGGIYNTGTLTVTNSTLSGNSVYGYGGGFYGKGGQATLTNATVSLNIADNDNDVGGDGGGFLITNGSILYLQNTIVAGNTDLSSPVNNDCANQDSTLTSLGHNLVGSGPDCFGNGPGDRSTTDPRLISLADNGGDTWTHAILFDSPAIDFGICLAGITTDQRGFSRPYPTSGACDIGAYEWRGLIFHAYLPLVLR